MRALCPDCGFYHQVIRELEDGPRDVFGVAPLGECQRAWLQEPDLRLAEARFEQPAILEEEDDG